MYGDLSAVSVCARPIILLGQLGWSLTLLTVGSLPAGQAHLVAFLAAGVVTELIVPWTAERGAGRVVVVIGTLHPYPGSAQERER